MGDGAHDIVFRVRDAAGHEAEARASVRVDTQPPVLEAVLEGEQANGWYLGSVVFKASAADGGSGLVRLE